MPFTLVTAIRGTEMGHLIFEAKRRIYEADTIIKAKPKATKQRLCLYIDSYHFNPSVSVKIKVTDHRPAIRGSMIFTQTNRLEFDAEFL